MATFISPAGSHPYPAGTNVFVYPDLGQKPEGPPPGAIASVSSGIVAANGTLTFVGLTEGARYYMAAQVSGVWRWMIFRAADLSTSDQLAAHEADTTNVHGIPDTSLLRTEALAGHPVYVEEYGVLPTNSAATNSANIVTALAAAEAVRTADAVIQGTVLIFGEGHYDFSAEFASGGCSVVGQGKHVTMLRWPSDPGAGKYGIKATAGFAEAFYADLTLQGGSNNPGMGGSPRDQDGILLPAGCWMFDVKVAGFRRGVQGNGDHWGLVRVTCTNNQDGIDWGLFAQSAKSDQRLISCRLESNYRSGIAVPYGDKIAGATLFDTHIANSPFGIYGYNDSSGVTEPVLMEGSTWIQGSFENIGNGFIFEDRSPGSRIQRVLDNKFDIAGSTTLDPAFYWSSKSRDYVIDVKDFTNNEDEQIGANAGFLGAVGDLGCIRAPGDATGNVSHTKLSNVQAPFAAGKKMFSDDSDARRTVFRMRDAGDGKAVMRKTTASVAVGDALGSANAFPATCRPWQLGDVYLGIALATAGSGVWIPVATDGDNINGNSTAGNFDVAPNGQYYAVPDAANAGKLRVLPNYGTRAFDVGSVADGAFAVFDINCHGARMGDVYAVSCTLDLPDGIWLTARPRAAGVVEVTFHNESGSAHDPASATYMVVPNLGLPVAGWGYVSLSAGAVVTLRLTPGMAAA